MTEIDELWPVAEVGPEPAAFPSPRTRTVSDVSYQWFSESEAADLTDMNR